MTRRLIAATVVLFVVCGPSRDQIAAGAQAAQAAQLPTGTLDKLLAPIALYPDSLLAQMLMSATDPAKITELDKWLKANQTLKGTPLQDAAVKAGFDASFVALVLFPQVVAKMADQIAWTTELGQAFTSDRSAVFASIQKLRLQAKNVGTLKSSPQQEVETKTTSAGQEVIVIEPTNPQIVYVPQYNTEVVYTQPPTTVVVVRKTMTLARRSRLASSGSRPGSRLARRWTTTTTTVRTDGAAAATCTTTPGTTTTTIGKTLARTGRITARTSPRSAAIARRTDRNSGPSALARPRSSARTVNRRGRKIDRSRRRNERAEHAGDAGRDAQHSGSHRKCRSPRLRRRKQKSASDATERRQLGRILGIFERTIGHARPVLVDNGAEAAARARAGAAVAAAGERFRKGRHT